MSYQIKSTPFFRRMLSNSRRNGELQRLKDEYEKMKDFSDRSIELKMRQLRLKRLFKEIEDLKEINMKKRRLSLDNSGAKIFDKSLDNRKKKSTRHHNHRTSNKDMLDSWSFREDDFTPSSSGIRTNKVAIKSKARDSEDLNRVRLTRRLDYGNQISSWNLNRMVANKVAKEMSMLVSHKGNTKRSDMSKRKQQSETAVIQNKKQMLRHRLDYGNSKSHGNLNKPSNKSKATLNGNINAKSEIQHFTSSTTLIPTNVNNPNNDNRNYINPHTTGNVINKNTSEMFSCFSSKPSDDKNNYRGKELWQKVVLLSQPRAESSKAMKILEKCSSELDYQLRNISNDTDLSTLTNLDGSLHKGPLTLSENNLIENETLTRIETYEPIPTRDSFQTLHYNQEENHFQPEYQQYQRYQHIQPLNLQYPIKQPNLQKTEQMDIITQFMPFIEDTVKKEASTFCVKKLRRIFEEKHAA